MTMTNKSNTHKFDEYTIEFNPHDSGLRIYDNSVWGDFLGYHHQTGPCRRDDALLECDQSVLDSRIKSIFEQHS